MASDSSALTELTNEIHWLSAELKRRTALRSDQERLLLASKGLLHTLSEQGPRTVPAIAEARNTSRQNIQVIADRLAEIGCVEFVPNPQHKKSDLLRLTPSGSALLKSSTKQETTVLNGIAERMNGLQLSSVLEGLKQLRTILTDECETPQKVKSPTRTETSATEATESGHSETSVLEESVPRTLVQGTEPVEDDSLPVNLL